MVDVPSVVCAGATPPAPGTAELNVSFDNLDQTLPHVFTFYRTSAKAVSVEFQVVDALGKVVVMQNMVDLQALTVRRLELVSGAPASTNSSVQVGRAIAKTRKPLILKEFHCRSFFCRLIQRLKRAKLGDAVDMEEKQWQKVSDGAAVVTGWSGSSSRQLAPRPAPAPRPSPRRRRSPPSSPSPPRRRRNSISARRRGNAGNPSAPQTGVGGSRYSNANGQSYGYTSPTTMNSNFPGGYKQTGYGYSGKNAYTPSMGKAVMLGAAAGVTTGIAASYLYSRWNSWDRCRYGTTWTGSCKDCYNSYTRSQCMQAPPPEDANRDDLMNTGFWPDDFTGPLKVIVTAVQGLDYAAARICPPTGWDPNATLSTVQWTVPNSQDIFLTLTAMAELADSANGAFATPLPMLRVTLLVAFLVQLLNN